MDIEAFAAAHQAEWDRLGVLVRRRRRLTGPEIDELVRLYQRAGTHLSQLRASAVSSGAADPARTALLAALVASARSAVTGVHVPTWKAAARFAVAGFPAAVYRARWWWLGTTAVSLVLALVIAWWIVRSPLIQNSLVPPQEARDLVRHQFQGYYSANPASSFAAQVWTNNVWVAAQSLIFGILLGLPTLYVLLNNAVNLGLNAGYMIAHGKSVLFFSLILPHGMLELSSVFLAAAAGLRLGWTVIDPGGRPRGQALAQEGRSTVTIALGMIAALGVSGVIEAFVTPSSLSAWARITIGAVAAAAFIGYSLWFGRRAVRAGETGDMEEAPDLLPHAAG